MRGTPSSCLSFEGCHANHLSLIQDHAAFYLNFHKSLWKSVERPMRSALSGILRDILTSPEELDSAETEAFVRQGATAACMAPWICLS